MPTPVSLGSEVLSGVAAPSSESFTLTGSIQAGDTVVVAVGMDANSGNSVNSCSDGHNTYNLITSAGSGATILYLFAAYNCVAVASPSISTGLTYTGSGNWWGINVARIPGLLSAPLDSGATNVNASGTSVTSNALASAAEIVIATAWCEGTGVTDSNPFTQLAKSVNTFLIDLAYDLVSSTSAVTYTPSVSGSGTAPRSIITAFKIVPVLRPPLKTYLRR